MYKDSNTKLEAPQRPWRKWIGIGVSALVLGALAYHLRGSWEQFRVLKVESWPSVFLVTFTTVLFIYLQGSFFARVLSEFGVSPSGVENFELSLASRLGNYVTPYRGGVIIRAVYLKAMYQLSFIRFSITLGASYFVTFFTAGFLGLVALGFAHTPGEDASKLLGIIFMGSCVGTAVLAYLIPMIPLPSWAERFHSLAESLRKILRNKKLLFSLVLLTLAQCLTTIVMVMAGYQVFGVEISWAHSTILMAMMQLSTVVSITPAGLGIYEGAMVIAADASGIDAITTLGVAITERVINLAILLPLGSWVTYRLTSRMATKRRVTT